LKTDRADKVVRNTKASFDYAQDKRKNTKTREGREKNYKKLTAD